MSWSWSSHDPRRALSPFLPALSILAIQILLFPMGRGGYSLAVVSGLLTGLVALGLALVHRANRIVNFAQGDLGTVPTVVTVGIVAVNGLPWIVAVSAGLLTAVVLGAVVELAIVRRFWKAPRLLLTVATIGVSQLLLVCGGLLPRWWGKKIFIDQTIPQPFSFSLDIGEQTFRANELLTVIVVPVLLLGLAFVLRRTDLGVAIRASAERADRAALLGVPVRRLQTLVWATAGGLSFIGVFLHASIFGVGAAGALSIQAMLFALGAFVIGRMDHLPAVVVSALALRILGQGVSINNPETPGRVYVVLAAVVLVVLVLRRATGGRADADPSGSWSDAAQIRPLPVELRDLRPIRFLRFGAPIAVVAIAALLPLVLSPSNVIRLSSVAVFSLVALSIVVLTGWAGQVSLGQMSFVATGAVVGAIATSTWHLDLTLALIISGAAGAVVAVAVGMPALRPQGLLGTVRLGAVGPSWVAAASVAGLAVGGAVLIASDTAAAAVGAGLAVAAGVIAFGGWLGRGRRAGAIAVPALGQLAFVVGSGAAAAVVFGRGADATTGILVTAGIGALLAFVVGLPTERFPGLYLAVTTLAFALAAQNFLLNRQAQSWIPRGRIERPRLLRHFDLDGQNAMYYVVLGVVVLCFLAVSGIRRSRTGRVLIAVRDNDQAAAGMAVPVGRAKMAGFALSGVLAAVAGCLFVHVTQEYAETPFVAQESLGVFTAAVVGGLGSWTGPILGAAYLKGGEFYLPDNWRLLPTAVGVLGVLLILPGGLSELVYRLRDGFLRWFARRRDLIVPSLLADRADDPDTPPPLEPPAFDLEEASA